MANYQLGAVSPFVEQVARILGPMFGIETIYGYRAKGSVPDSDHPKGKALDFMVSTTSVGNALSAFLIANHNVLGVKYIVWNRKSWNPQRKTWEPYTSTDNPHTDHVHVSFLDKKDVAPLAKFASGFAAGVAGGLGWAVDGAGEGISGLEFPNPLDPFGVTWVSQILKPDMGRRIGTAIIGVGFVIAGLVFIARRPIGSIVGSVSSGVGSVASAAVQGWGFGLGAGATGGIGRATGPVSSTPVTTPTRPGPRPPAIEPPSNAPTTSVLPRELYAPVSPGGTYQVTAVGRVANPTEYRRPEGASLLDIAGKRNPAPKPKKSKKGTHITSVSAPMRNEPYGGQ